LIFALAFSENPADSRGVNGKEAGFLIGGLIVGALVGWWACNRRNKTCGGTVGVPQ
jgi:hypothetical protein